jgi:hypothetical protein
MIATKNVTGHPIFGRRSRSLVANPIITPEAVRGLLVKNGSLVWPGDATNKFNVAPKADRTDAEGTVYASKAELVFGGHLEIQRRAGIVAAFFRQVPFDLKSSNGTVICRYVADFDVRYADGRRVLYDVKGVATEMFKLKRKWMRAEYPGIDLQIRLRGELP